MRIGILGLLHESNTFVSGTTTVAKFREDLYLDGDAILTELAESHHEIGGFCHALQNENRFPITIVPLVAFRATPSGPIAEETFDQLVKNILRSVDQAGRLDGVLVAAHGAAVAENHPDADGDWLTLLRQALGNEIPLIGTIDPHANLSARMVAACDALIAYRTNPHLDQRQRGIQAGKLLLDMLAGQVRPTMRACFPPLVINIERQLTAAEPLASLFQMADEQLQNDVVLSNSLILGFPYSDVREMGAATIAICNDNPELAQKCADQLALAMWNRRSDLRGIFISVEQALEHIRSSPGERCCLLDMGDNVGGGSAADGTTIAAALTVANLGYGLVSIFDPEVVALCEAEGVGSVLPIRVGGKSDGLHGKPLEVTVDVISLHAGRFRESQPRHGGIMEFDQGRTAVVRVRGTGLTLLITSKRMVPFSLEQLRSCGLNPLDFRVLVAKGVHAPVAAYREVCDTFIRVNTPGATSADLSSFPFLNRRQPLYPFEDTGSWQLDNSLG